MNEKAARWIEMTLRGIFEGQSYGQKILTLQAKDEDIYLDIFTGTWEAEAVTLKESSRPMPYDLIKSLIGHLNATLSGVYIYGLVDNTFYAKVVLYKQNKQKIEIDCRPTDGIGVSRRMGAKIFVLSEVLDRASRLDKSSGKEKVTDKSVTADEIRKMSAFAEFIQTLDIDDLGKNRN